jgi:hypothetical protein
LSGQCRGYGCTSTALVKAHIIPQSFARLVQGQSGPNVMLSEEGTTMKLPRGVYDPRILCEQCDGHLNTRYDEPAFRFFRSFDLAATKIIDLRRSPYEDTPSYFELPTADCDMLSGFVLSVLWRSSISKRPEFSDIRLGPYEDQVREVLWGLRPLSSLRSFELTIHRYRSPQVEIDKTYSLPGRIIGSDLTVYGFACLGFDIQAKVDNRPLPRCFNHFVINRTKVLRGLIINFDETRQARELCRMANMATQNRQTRSAAVRARGHGR